MPESTDKRNQEAVEGAATGQSKKTSSSGGISLDVRTHSIVNSTIEGEKLRRGIRGKFVEAVTQLTGLEGGDAQGGLARFLSDDLTSGPGMEMPGNSADMLEKLNTVYLKAICALYGGGDLSLYVAEPLGGSEFYCIGENGEIFCYHGFSLRNSDTKELLSVSHGGVTCPVCLVCRGLS